MSRTRCLIAVVLTMAGILSSPIVASALQAGDILVCDYWSGLIAVDPATGGQSYLTQAHGFADVATDKNGNIYTLIAGGGEIYKVDASTGSLTTVSSGYHLYYSNFLDVSPDGSIIAQANNAPYGYGLVKIDPASGTPTLIAPGLHVDAMAVVDDRTAYVMSWPKGSISDWYVYRLDLATGDTVRVSNWSFHNPSSLAIESSSSLIVAESYGTVYRVYPALGAGAPVAHAPASCAPDPALTDVAVESNGRILFVDHQGGLQCNPRPTPCCQGAVYGIDPASGTLTTVSAAGNFWHLAGMDVYLRHDSTPTRNTTWGRLKVLYR